MSRVTYPILLEPAEDGAFGVIFPGLDGCVSFGADMDEAIANAADALSLHLEGLAEDKEPIPAPLPMADIVLDHPDRTSDTIWAAVTVEAPDASDRVGLYLPRSLLERADRYGADHGLNRSSLISLALRKYLDAESRAGVQPMLVDGFASWDELVQRVALTGVGQPADHALSALLASGGVKHLMMPEHSPSKTYFSAFNPKGGKGDYGRMAPKGAASSEKVTTKAGGGQPLKAIKRGPAKHA